MPTAEARRRDERLLRGLRLRILLALGLLASLAAGSYLLFRAQSAALGTNAGVLNLCARQRMLSQRAALLIDQLEASSDEAERRRLQQELREIADTMEDHARRLFGGGPALVPPAVRARVLDSGGDLPGALRRFVDGVRTAADAELGGPPSADPRVASTLAAARDGSILRELEHVVDVMQVHSETQVQRVQRAQLLALGLSLTTLALLVLLVFRPLVRGLRRHLAELRRSQVALHEQSEQLQLNFENAPLGIARCDLEGRLLSVNPALAGVLGRPVDELMGRPLEGLMHPDDHARLLEAQRRSERARRSHQTLLLRLRHRDGSWRTGMLHWSRVVGEDDTAIGWIAHFEDRTRQLQVEEQARRDREHLSRLGRLHTLGEMAAGIAHEVNQPLTAISSYAAAGRRMLEFGLTDATALAATLDKMSAQAQRAGEVIRGLRAFARNRRSRTERVDPNRLVREAIALAEAGSQLVDVAVEIRLQPDMPDVLVDPVQIQQVILNLIRNAVEAVREAGPSEPILVSTAGNGDGFVQVTVEDHGAGVLPDVASRLFDPFFTSKESGLGMGLAISRSIVTSHGGRIWWTAVEGGGARFHFTLPAVSGG